MAGGGGKCGYGGGGDAHGQLEDLHPGVSALQTQVFRTRGEVTRTEPWIIQSRTSPSSQSLDYPFLSGVCQ